MTSANLFLAGLCFLLAIAAQGQAPSVTVVAGGESARPAADVRRVVVGPGINDVEAFPGYGGSIAWAGAERAKDGALIVAFNAGYWHVSPPTPFVMSDAAVARYRKIGMPRDISAATGGRLMFVRSTDGGKSWTKPMTLIDTPADDRQAGLLTLRDGTILATFFTSYGEVDATSDPRWFSHSMLVRSFDNGRTWEKRPRRIQPKFGVPFTGEATDGPAVLLKDSSILLTLYGGLPASENHPQTAAGLFESKNQGRTWKCLSVIKANRALEEAHTVQLRDGRLVMINRPEGDILWSKDGGYSWTAPVTFGMRIFAPTLYVMRDGTLLCLHGSYTPGHGGLRAIFSTDGGSAWIAPAMDHGFDVDESAYGYGAGVLLPDDSLFIIYQRTGSHRTGDAKSNSLLAVRLRVRSDHSGIDLLPPVAE